MCKKTFTYHSETLQWNQTSNFYLWQNLQIRFYLQIQTELHINQGIDTLWWPQKLHGLCQLCTTRNSVCTATVSRNQLELSRWRLSRSPLFLSQNLNTMQSNKLPTQRLFWPKLALTCQNDVRNCSKLIVSSLSPSNLHVIHKPSNCEHYVFLMFVTMNIMSGHKLGKRH